jgi:hypothetical protein
MELHVLRSLTLDGDKRFWLLYDKKNRLASRLGESLRSAIQRWTQTYGKPTRIVRHRGIRDGAKAALQAAHYQLERNDDE